MAISMLSQYTFISCQRKPDYINQHLTHKHCIFRFLCCLQTGKRVQYCCLPPWSQQEWANNFAIKGWCNRQISLGNLVKTSKQITLYSFNLTRFLHDRVKKPERWDLDRRKIGTCGKKTGDKLSNKSQSVLNPKHLVWRLSNDPRIIPAV